MLRTRWLCSVLLIAPCLAWAADAPAKNPGSAPASAQGKLEKVEIQRVIRLHINEVKRCYETQLAKNPKLSGKVMVRFVIDTDGKVTDSSIAETTLHDSLAEGCIAGAVRTWLFPKPQGGRVIVAYPFILANSDP